MFLVAFVEENKSKKAANQLLGILDAFFGENLLEYETLEQLIAKINWDRKTVHELAIGKFRSNEELKKWFGKNLMAGKNSNDIEMGTVR